MNSERYGRLTEAQRITLRLYHQHLQIKEIAQQLGISESTVNQRLTQCRRITGAPSSRAAAKWLAENETENGIYSPSTYRFSAIASASDVASSGAVTAMGTDDGNEDRDSRQDDGQALPPSVEPSHSPFPWPFPTKAAPRNQLSSWTRLALVGPVAACLLIAAMILVLLGIGFQDALASLQHLIAGS